MTGSVFYLYEYQRVVLHPLALNGLRVWLWHFNKLSDQKGRSSVTETDGEGVGTREVGIGDLPGVVVADGLHDGKAEAVADANFL